jgi:hypothetical protein
MTVALQLHEGFVTMIARLATSAARGDSGSEAVERLFIDTTEAGLRDYFPLRCELCESRGNVAMIAGRGFGIGGSA